MTDKTMFTELDQYQWFNDIDALEEASNLDLSSRLLSDTPPAPPAPDCSRPVRHCPSHQCAAAHWAAISKSVP